MHLAGGRVFEDQPKLAWTATGTGVYIHLCVCVYIYMYIGWARKFWPSFSICLVDFPRPWLKRAARPGMPLFASISLCMVFSLSTFHCALSGKFGGSHLSQPYVFPFGDYLRPKLEPAAGTACFFLSLSLSLSLWSSLSLYFSLWIRW